LLPRYHFVFRKWPFLHDFNTYGGKQMLVWKEEPLFAELLMLRLLESQGYTGVWVDTFRKKYWQRLPDLSTPILPDAAITGTLEKIYEIKGGGKTGCFDVVAYRENHFVFVELKRQKADVIQPSQIEWLEAAGKAGLNAPFFLIAEWKL